MIKRKSKITNIKINSWEEFLKIVNGKNYQFWAFRGQENSDWPLNSSLSRYLLKFGVNKKAWSFQEERIVRIFIRKSHLFLDKVPDMTDIFRWLSIMQHHGAPTRLIDFTWSPFVAAFFALERANQNAAIWALSFKKIWKLNENLPNLKKLNIKPRDPNSYKDSFLKNKYQFVEMGEPLIMNKRLTAQSGTFVIPGVLDKSVDDILLTYPHPEELCVKFELNTDSLRDEAMHELYNMNITHATLFPDLDGLSRSLAYELEFHWDFNPKTLKKYK